MECMKTFIVKHKYTGKGVTFAFADIVSAKVAGEVFEKAIERALYELGATDISYVLIEEV